MRKLYGGFVEGKLDMRTTDIGFGGWGQNFHKAPAIFTSQAEAKKQYQDVRPVEVLFAGKR